MNAETVVPDTTEPCCGAHVEPEPLWYEGACCDRCPQLLEALAKEGGEAS